MKRNMKNTTADPVAEQYLTHQNEFSDWMANLVKPRPFQAGEEETAN
jgi:hypothetical protein